MMSFLLARSWRMTSSSTLGESWARVWGSGRGRADMAAKNTLLRANEGRIPGTVVDYGGVRVDAAAQHLDAGPAVNDANWYGVLEQRERLQNVIVPAQRYTCTVQNGDPDNRLDVGE